jgi:predicted MFS family arabinose efflux permease
MAITLAAWVAFGGLMWDREGLNYLLALGTLFTAIACLGVVTSWNLEESGKR